MKKATFKKVFALVMALVMCLALVACGEKPAADDGAEAVTELTLWHIYGEGDAMYEATAKVIADAEAEFGITINAVTEETEAYKVKCAAAAAGNTLPDIFLTWGRSVIGQYIDADLLVNLSEVMSDDIANNVTGGSFAEFSKNGNVYAFTDANAVGALFCNKAMFDQYDLEIPETWEELLTACQTFIDNGITPFCTGAADAWTLAMYYDILAVRCVGTEGVENTFATGDFSDPGYLEAAEKLVELVEMGCFRDDAIALNRNDAEADFYAGKIPMMQQGSWTAARVYANAANPDDFVAVPFPVVHPDVAGAYALTGGGQTAFAVSKSSADVELAVAVAEYIAQNLADVKFANGGGISPYKSTPAETTNDLFFKTFEMSTSAESMNIWFDTGLDSETKTLYLNELQSLFAGTTTPEQFIANLTA